MAWTRKRESEPASHNPEAVVELLGRRVHVLELSPNMPAHHGHRLDLPAGTFVHHALTTPGVWVDLSFVVPRTCIRLDDIKRGMEAAGVRVVPPGATFMYWTGAEEVWGDPARCAADYPGLDSEAAAWILDQGVAHVCTDIPASDNPTGPSYSGHLTHGRGQAIHTELVANIRRIPRHEGFYAIALPQKLEGAAGITIRMIALWEEQGL